MPTDSLSIWVSASAASNARVVLVVESVVALAVVTGAVVDGVVVVVELAEVAGAETAVVEAGETVETAVVTTSVPAHPAAGRAKATRKATANNAA
jgi:hypothetical protein